MTFDNFAQAHSTVLWAIFALAVILGAVANKTNFCTMGAVSDLVNIGDSGRMCAWLFAMAVAMLGVVIMESAGLVDLASTRPPYRGSNFAWLEYLLGGILFGIGMTLGSGCGNKTLIRLGGGNLKSVMVFALIAVCAYFMLNPFPGTDKTLYSELFYFWTNPTSVSMEGPQDIGSVISRMGLEAEAVTLRLVLGGALALGLIGFALKSKDFRGSFDNILGGAVVGLVVLGAWYATTALVTVVAEEDQFSWTEYGSDENWDMFESEERPRDIGVQSFTFINPMGQTLRYSLNSFDNGFVTFGVVSVAGVILGSLLWALISRGFRFEWFVSLKDFFNHLVGGILMGIGGVLALGCTIGQAVSGASTLALGSFIAFGGIVFGSTMTMKIQYYRMVYEEEASFLKAFITSLVDLKLLPPGMRMLDAV